MNYQDKNEKMDFRFHKEVSIPLGKVTVQGELIIAVEVILAKKIGHPMHKKYAIGAASLTDYFIVPHDDVTEEYIQQELQRVRSSRKPERKNSDSD